jgi:hypothetical protein
MDVHKQETKTSRINRGNVNKMELVGFAVLTAVVMKSTIFWDITPCGPLKGIRRFGGTYRLHLQGRKNKLSKKPAYASK